MTCIGHENTMHMIFRELYFIFKNAVNMHLLLLTCTSNMGHDDDDNNNNLQ